VLGLKKRLDRLYKEYDFKGRIRHDPIEFPRRYSMPEDIEIAGFIASCLAYGKVELFRPVIEKILSVPGKNLHTFVLNFSPEKDRKYLNGIRYRFNREEDILCLIYFLSQALRKHGSLKNLFCSFYSPGNEDTGKAISGFVNFLLSTDTSVIYRKNIRPYGLIQLLPSPEKGSACKRMNLFLRWMVRNKDIDLGIWKDISPSRLIIPLDTHIAKISKCLNLTRRVTADWKMAKEVTESLKKLDPSDPLKYDFALCHHGISGMCQGQKFRDTCSTCSLKLNLSLPLVGSPSAT